jgi:flagellar protein FliS
LVEPRISNAPDHRLTRIADAQRETIVPGTGPAFVTEGGAVQAVGYGAYRKVQAETSSPAELVVLLYDALLKNLYRALAGFDAHESDRVNDGLTLAQDITLELRASLDPNSDLAEQLAPLYDYLFRQLINANTRKERAVVDEVINLVTPVRNAWASVIRGERPAFDGEAVGE